MRDSTVQIYEGPRGSGKTLSAAFECARRMIIYDEVIISNVPISFDLVDDAGNNPAHYESRPLSIDSIVTMAEEVRNATIFWDEMSLWLYSRSSGAALNRLVTLVFTMLRKRKLSLIITTQALRFLDKNIQFQCDTLVDCFDMSYRQHTYLGHDGVYHKTERGAEIYQTWRDNSGINTGVRYSDDGRVYPMYFRGKIAWGIYDTDYEFDVLDAQTKYKVQSSTKVVTKEGISNAIIPASGFEISSLIASLPDARYRAGEIEEYFNLSGVDVAASTIGRYLKRAGYEKHRDRDGYFYERDG